MVKGTEEGFRSTLRTLLHSLFPSAKDGSGGRWVNINCPLCNRDPSLPDDHNRHMGIFLGDEDKPPMYNCFKNMEHRGLLTKSSLEHLVGDAQCVDPLTASDLQSYVKGISKVSKYRLNKSGKYNLFNSIPKETSFIRRKLDYINNRMKTNLEYNDLLGLKCILSLYDFLSYNRINVLTRDKFITDCLDKYFIGFLTNTNGSIVFKNIADSSVKLPPSIDNRYIVYNIFEGTVKGYYILPTTCCIDNHIDCFIAEGPFDILSVYFNMTNMNTAQKIYASIGGNTYLNVIKFLVSEMGLIDISLYVYIDNDIHNSIMDGLITTCKDLLIPLEVHSNSYPGEKDFGVSPDRIKDVIIYSNK